MSSRQRKIVSDGETPAGGHFAAVGDESVLARQGSGINSSSGIFDIKMPLTSRQFCFIVASILLIGLALRLPNLTKSLWLDESYSAWFAAMSFHQLWSEMPQYEVHPPFYCMLLSGWSELFGRTEAALRSLSVVASLATILLVAISAKILRAGAAGDRAALLGALFLAINAGNINYAQEARSYSLETLTASIAILSSFVLLQKLQQQGRDNIRDLRPLLPSMAGLAIGAGLTLWMHNTGLFVAYGIWIGLTLSLLTSVRGNRLHQMLAVGLPGVFALLIWSPFLPKFLRQSSEMGGLQYWIKPSSHDILSAWYLVGGGGYSFLMIGTFAVLFLGLVYRWQKAFAILPTTILFLPWATILAINYLIKPIFIDRLFEWMAPTVLGLAATGIVFGLKQSSSRLIVTLAVVSFCLYSSYSYYVTPTENWRGVVKTIFAEMQPGDVIVASPNEITVPLSYYVSDEKALSDILFVPSPFPALNLDRPYIAGLGAPKIIPSDGALVTDAIRMHPRVWLIERRSDIYDPEEVVRSAISASHKLRKAFSSADIMVTLFE